jgi:biopolymer transport protein ExbD
MTPLIDCVFQLLIVFMLAAAFQAPAIQLSLPRAATQDPAGTPEVLVSVDAAGRMFVNAEPVRPEQLEAVLRPRVAASKSRVVTFRGDDKAPYEWFVKVLDAARASGAVNLDVEHQPPGERGTP